MPGMKVAPCDIEKFVLNFHDHQRWLIRWRVGLTHSHFWRRVWPPLEVHFSPFAYVSYYDRDNIYILLGIIDI